MNPFVLLALLVVRGTERLNRRFSLVGDRPFFEPAQFPWVNEVEAMAAPIQRELATLLERREALPNFQDISPDQKMLTLDSRWKTFFFYAYGHEFARNCEACPQTVRALERIPGMTTAFYSILAPGKRLPPHRGPYNGVLRFHMGLKVPAHDATCAIKVGNETRNWHEGKSLLFDDTYQHTAWNLTSEWRVVLFVDFKRPLPVWLRGLNNLMIWLISKTPFITVATRNHKDWEKTFYDA